MGVVKSVNILIDDRHLQMMGKNLNRKAQSSFLVRRPAVGEKQIEIFDPTSSLGEIYYEYLLRVSHLMTNRLVWA